jgi:hypothetical protein
VTRPRQGGLDGRAFGVADVRAHEYVVLAAPSWRRHSLGGTLRKTSLVGAVICAAAITGLNISAADAAGQVERGPEHANSLCSYSGLNDDPEEDGNRTQSYGQLVKDGLKAFVPSPGLACNPNTVFEE